MKLSFGNTLRSLVTDLLKRDAFSLYIQIGTSWWWASNRMVSRAINDKIDSWQLKELNFFVQRTWKIMAPLSYHSSNLSLIALEAMRLLVLIHDLMLVLKPLCEQHFFFVFYSANKLFDLFLIFFFLVEMVNPYEN